MEPERISVRAVIRCKYRPRTEGDREHSHRFYQMVVVAEGDSYITLGGERTAATAGDIFFIRPGVMHSLQPVEGKMTTYEVKLDLDAEMAEMLSAVPSRIEGGADRVRDLLSFAVEEALARNPHYRKVIDLAVESALLLLARSHVPTPTVGIPLVSRVEGAPSGIAAVREYLTENYHERVTLGLLARRFSLTREHLCRTFTAAYGVSPIHYLNECRHAHACRLLAETDMTVTEIAAATGYSSIHYFSRAFSAAAGISPYEYRRRNRDSFCVELTEGQK